MTHCVFCEILAGSLEASVVHEDEDMMIIMDAYPLGDGHCLVIPKHHYELLSHYDEKTRQKLFEWGHAVLNAQREAGFGREGSNILLNDGKAANQTVPHLHLHVIPRKKHDVLATIPRLALHASGIWGFFIPREKLNQQAKLIAQHLNL